MARPTLRTALPAAGGLALAVACATPLPSLTSPVPSQSAGTASPKPAGIEVFLVTMEPGTRSWERFGHNGLWIRDPANGIDAVYNYGLFSFQQEGFLLRFLQGRMTYWMQGLDATSHLDWYRRENRTVWLQELNLSPEQRVELRDFLLQNERPENRFYRYDYYLDNCSTRVRDAIDRVIGGKIREQTMDVRPGATFRFHTRRLTTADLALYTGLQIGLGHFVDRPISAWEEMFLPLKVREHVRGVTVTDTEGNAAPLVLSERALHEGTGPAERAAPPVWWPGYLLTGIGIAALLLVFANTGTTSRAARIGFAAVGTMWAGISGVLGAILLALWLLTDHTAAHWNENLLLFSPLMVPLAAVLPFSVSARSRLSTWALWLSGAAATLALAALVGKVFPSFYQGNGELIALTLPPSAALVWGIRRLAVA